MWQIRRRGDALRQWFPIPAEHARFLFRERYGNDASTIMARISGNPYSTTDIVNGEIRFI